MKIIKGDLIMTEDMVFNEDLRVLGNIYGKDRMKYNITANDISAFNIICETRKKKDSSSKTFCRIYITNKSKIKRSLKDE